MAADAAGGSGVSADATPAPPPRGAFAEGVAEREAPREREAVGKLENDDDDDEPVDAASTEDLGVAVGVAVGVSVGVSVGVVLAVSVSVLESDEEEEPDGVMDAVGVTEIVEVGVGVTEIVEDGDGVFERVAVDVVDATKHDVAPLSLVVPAGHGKQAVPPVDVL